MTSFEQCRSLFNINYIQGDIMRTDPLWSVADSCFKAPIDEKSRQAVLDWLTRVLLTYSFPPAQKSMNALRECFSPNLSSFFTATRYLISLGYPSHWFRIYIQEILSSQLASVETYPQKSPNRKHEPLIHKRKLNLSAILLEFSILTAVYSPTLGIGANPTTLNASSIRNYRMRVNLSPMASWTGYAYANVLGLLFEENSSNSGFVSGSDTDLRQELINASVSSRAQRHLFSVFRFSSSEGLVTFLMPEKQMADMQRSSSCWQASLIRTDSWKVVTFPVKMSQVKLSKKQFD